MTTLLTTPFFTLTGLPNGEVEAKLLDGRPDNLVTAALLVLSLKRTADEAPHLALPEGVREVVLTSKSLDDKLLKAVTALRGVYSEPIEVGRTAIFDRKGVTVAGATLVYEKPKWKLQTRDSPGVFRGSFLLLCEMMAHVNMDDIMTEGDFTQLFRPWLTLRPDDWEGTQLKKGKPPLLRKIGDDPALQRLLAGASAFVDAAGALTDSPADLTPQIQMADLAAKAVRDALQKKGVSLPATAPAPALAPSAPPPQPKGRFVAVPDGMSDETARERLSLGVAPKELSALLVQARATIAGADKARADAAAEGAAEGARVAADAKVLLAVAKGAEQKALRP